MTNSDDSFFSKAYNPMLQAGIALGMGILFMIVAKLIRLTGLIEIGERFPWLTAASFMLCFALFNSVFSLSSKNLAKYWGRSIMSFMGLAVASGLMAYLFSSIPIREAGSYPWIYVVLTFGYLIFLSMMASMKKIVEFAQREEWNQPRIRRKRDKRRDS